jgi:putative inorganic carbon (HCO3(-)) transporter
MLFSGQQNLLMAVLLVFLCTFPMRRLWPWVAGATAITTSIILSFTRSVWISSAVVFIGVLLRFRRRILWVVPTVLVLLGLIFHEGLHRRVDSLVDTHFSSNAARVLMVQAGWKMFREHPWFGVGPQQIDTEFRSFLQARGIFDPPFYTGHLHNNFIQLAAERGLFALVAFLWLLIELLVRCGRASYSAGDNSEWRTIYLAALLATLALTLAGLFEFNFLASDILILFLFIITAPFVAGRDSDLTQPHSIR